MMINDGVGLVISLMAGVLIGVLFFYGLWWTVRNVVRSDRPALWSLGSMVLRMMGALAGFYVVARGSWQRLLMCFLGFFLARLIVTRLTCRADNRVYAKQEIRHDPQP